MFTYLLTCPDPHGATVFVVTTRLATATRKYTTINPKLKQTPVKQLAKTQMNILKAKPTGHHSVVITYHRSTQSNSQL